MQITSASRNNSFDLLRLVAALLVLWSHQFSLLGMAEPQIINGTLGVYIFFGISGYLNAQSILNNASWWRFLIRRAQRIYPALFVFALFCVAVALLVTTADMATIWEKIPTFVFKNTAILFGLEQKLPGVFLSNPVSGINVTLWTLPNEIKLYIYLALVALAARYSPRNLLVIFSLLLVGLLIWFVVSTKNMDTVSFLKFAVIFLTGTLFAAIERQSGIVTAFVVLIAICVASAFSASVVSFFPAIALASILFGKLRSPSWLRPRIDISYGFYLYAYPVQQIVASYRLPFWESLLLSLAGSVFLGIASALLVERPALAWGRRNLKEMAGPSQMSPVR